MSEQHLPELAADRQADLEKKIGHLEKDAASIPGMADYYAGFARDFRQEQANLTGDEREAHGHDYAGSLARIVANHRTERGDTDTAALLEKEADTRFAIAADLRGQPRPDETEYQEWRNNNLDGDEAKHLATMETAAEQQQDPAFANAITEDEIAPEPQSKNWLETAAENVRAMNAEAQGQTLDNIRVIVSDAMKDPASYVALDRQAPDIDPDPDKPRGGKPSPDMPSGPSEGRNYDALKSSHADTQAMLDENERRKGNAPPVAEIEGPTRPSHIRATMAAEPAPDGTKSTRSTYYDPNDNPAMSDYKAANAEPRPMHPDEHAARFSEDLETVATARIVEGAAPAERTLVAAVSAEERFAARIAAIDGGNPGTPGKDNSRHLETLQQAESTTRQESDRKADAGEAQGDAPARPMNAEERFAARIAAIDAVRESFVNIEESGHSLARTAGRGMAM